MTVKTVTVESFANEMQKFFPRHILQDFMYFFEEKEQKTLGKWSALFDFFMRVREKVTQWEWQ